MRKLTGARRKRFPRALKAETAASSAEMTGLIPAFTESEAEENAYRQMYPMHKARRY